MAITIQAQLAKKVPIPGNPYSSQQASITISAEVNDLSQVVAEAQRLYALAENSVNQQLGLVAADRPEQPAPRTAAPAQQRPAAPSAPYRSTSGQRRGPAPITDSQLRFLKQLVERTGVDLSAILQQHQVGSLQELTCKAAAGLIDELKSRAPA